MDRRPAKPFRIAALAAVLIAAQTAALVHADLEPAHPSSDVCALCVGLATLGAGNVTASEQVPALVAITVPVDYLLSHPVPHRAARPLARGPPLAS
jgi:hypothetical protein